MLEEKNVKNFETQFLDIADERKILDAKEIKPISVYDPEAKEVQKSTLENIFSSVFDEENLEPESLEEQTDEQEQETAPVAQDQEEKLDTTVSPIVEPPREPTETFSGLPEEAQAILATPSLAFEQPSETETPVIEDNIEDIEKIPEDEEIILDDTDADYNTIVLPDSYLKNMEEVEEIEDAPVTKEDQVSQEEDLGDLLGEAEHLLFESEDLETIDDTAYSQEDLEKMFRSEEELETKKVTYKSTRDFQKEDEVLFFNHLENYSIYLRNAIIDVVSNDEYTPQIERLVDLILDEASPNVVHHEIEKLLQYTIAIPSDTHVYKVDQLKNRLLTPTEKIKRGAYTVMTKSLPLAASILLVLFYGFFFVVQPLRANKLYKIGYEQLEEKDPLASEETFKKATDIWVSKKYFFQYAELYKRQKKFVAEQTKYEQLIFGSNDAIRDAFMYKAETGDYFTPVLINNKKHYLNSSVRYDKNTFLTIADLEVARNKDFERARAYYNLWLSRFPEDNAMQYKLADMYIAWYDNDHKPLHLDFAKEIYNALIVKEEHSDLSLLYKLRWAVRSEDLAYIERVYSQIGLANDLVELNDNTLQVYLDLIEYKINNHDVYLLANIMDSVVTQYPQLVDMPYYYARYYYLLNEKKYSLPMLQKSIDSFATARTLSTQQYENYIDSYIMQAEITMEYENNIFAAEEYLKSAQLLFQTRQNDYNVTHNAYLSRMYYFHSRIALLQGDLSQAINYLHKNKYVDTQDPEIAYYTGLTYYLNQDWDYASHAFLSIMEDPSITLTSQQKSILLLASANSLFFQNNYYAAAVYYERLITLLDNNNSTVNIIGINLDRQIELLNFKTKIAQIKNNLGVSLQYVAKQSHNNQQYNTEAFDQLQQSNRILQNLHRSRQIQNLGVRKNITELATTNTAALLTEQDLSEFNIYSEIALSINNKNYWQVAKSSINPTEADALYNDTLLR